MKICVFGAGAVGGHIAARLLAAGCEETSIVARGTHLAAVQRQGLRLRIGGAEYAGRPCAASDAPQSLPAQDLVIVALKAPALPAAAAAIHRLLKPEGTALFVLNGIPWWWQHGLPGGKEGPLALLDPAGALWRLLRQRTLACVCHASNEVIAPGVIEGTPGDSWLLGDPVAPSSPRLNALVGLFQQAGFDASGSKDLRREIWKKLLINASLNPVSALTRLATLHLTTDAQLRACLTGVMYEVLEVARASGCDLQSEMDVDAWLAPEKRSPTHRTSMLQDVLAGRTLETEALLGQTLAFARESRVATPLCDILLALLRGLGRSDSLPARRT